MNTQRILIVDDDSKVALSLSRVLKHSNRNCDVNVANSGEEALDVFDNWPVDLLITDLCMPGISGLELIRRTQQISPQTRTILITAYGDGSVEAEARRLSVYRYITKPFHIEVLLDAVQKVLAR